MAQDGSRTAQRWRQGMEQLTLRDLIGYWAFHNRTEGKSPNTVRWYDYELGMFERFLVAQDESTLIGEIGEPQVRAYIAYLQQKRKPWGCKRHAAHSYS